MPAPMFHDRIVSISQVTCRCYDSAGQKHRIALMASGRLIPLDHPGGMGPAMLLWVTAGKPRMWCQSSIVTRQYDDNYYGCADGYATVLSQKRDKHISYQPPSRKPSVLDIECSRDVSGQLVSIGGLYRSRMNTDYTPVSGAPLSAKWYKKPQGSNGGQLYVTCNRVGPKRVRAYGLDEKLSVWNCAKTSFVPFDHIAGDRDGDLHVVRGFVLEPTHKDLPERIKLGLAVMQRDNSESPWRVTLQRIVSIDSYAYTTV